MKFILITSILTIATIAIVSWFQKFDFKEYQEHLADPNYSEITYHFPKTFTSTPIAQYYTPRALQGGSCFQILCRDKNAIALFNSYSMKYVKKITGPIKRFVSDYKDIAHAYPSNYVISSHEDFSPEWEIGILGANPYMIDDLQMWNHGKSWGLAINSRENLILYWAESW